MEALAGSTKLPNVDGVGDGVRTATRKGSAGGGMKVSVEATAVGFSWFNKESVVTKVIT